MKKLSGVLIFCSLLIVSGCGLRGPSPLSVLKTLYQEIAKFEILPADKVVFEWKENKARFEALSGKPTVLKIEAVIDEFQPPAETIKLRKGDCEDLAILFVSAARHLGFPARVVIGTLKPEARSPHGALHVWTEIFLEGKWQTVDPTLAPKVSFDWFFFHPYPREEIVATFDEKEFSGKSILELQKKEWEKMRTSLQEKIRSFLVQKFRAESGKKLTREILTELEDIAKHLTDQLINFYVAGVPENPQKLVQPHDLVLRDWIEAIKRRKS